MKKTVIFLLLVTLSFLLHGKDKIIIFHAGSLSMPFKQLEAAFEKKYPRFDVLREASGSRKAARKVSDLHRACDIMASADYTVIDQLLIAENHAQWNIKFVTNEMVIMYTPKSRYKDDLTKDNWFQILLKNDVEYGHSDHNADPCGYRTLLVWQLAEKFYQQPGLFQKLDQGCPPKNIRSAEVDLIALLEVGQLDYLFIYRSVAQQHHLPYLILPEKINLKNETHQPFYRQAKVNVSGKKPGEFIVKQGEPMVYGFTIPDNAQNSQGAVLFARFILSDQGKKILKQNGHPLIDPPMATGNIQAIPAVLKKYIQF